MNQQHTRAAKFVLGMFLVFIVPMLVYYAIRDGMRDVLGSSSTLIGGIAWMVTFLSIGYLVMSKDGLGLEDGSPDDVG